MRYQEQFAEFDAHVRCMLTSIGQRYLGGYCEQVVYRDELAWILASTAKHCGSESIRNGWRVELHGPDTVVEQPHFEVHHCRPLGYAGKSQLVDELLTCHRENHIYELIKRRIYDPDHRDYVTATLTLSLQSLRLALNRAADHGPCPVLWNALY